MLFFIDVLISEAKQVFIRTAGITEPRTFV